MRKLFSILLIFFSGCIYGQRTCFVSSTGNDANNGITAPIQTIAKVNSLALVSGDTVKFNGGDSFYGSLTAKSGVVYTSYGTGKAIWTGFTQLSLTSIGNNLYTSPASACNLVLMDGVFQPMGKMPKGNAYYTVSSVGTNSLSGTFTGNYTGGEIVWRPYHWVLWRGTVTSQNGATVNYTPFPATSAGSTENPQIGYGFFFQNYPSACTQTGEWAFKNGTLTINLDNASHVIKVPTVDVLINLGNSSNVILDNLDLQGANSYLINSVNATNITIQNCNLSYGGIYGIWGNGAATGWKITNNTISWNNSIAINASGSSGAWTVTGNTITNSATIPGMGGSGENQYFAIRGIRNGSTVSNNRIINTGYIPLMFSGINNIVSGNFIKNYGFVKDDAGGIYCTGQLGADCSGTKIIGNTVDSGYSSITGTPDKDNRVQGIYIDDGGKNIEVGGNVIADMGGSGVYCHFCSYINLHDNVFYNSGYASETYYNDQNQTVGITYKRNINFGKGTQLSFAQSAGSSSVISYFAARDSNLYTGGFQTNSGSYTLASWRSFIKKDSSSQITSVIPASILTLQGVVTYLSQAKSGAFTKNNCPANNIPSSIIYTVSAGKYSSTISQADADSKAQADINTNGQTYANANGTCTPKTIIKVVIYYSDGTTVSQQ